MCRDIYEDLFVKNCNDSYKSNDKCPPSLYCDGYPISEYERLIAEAIRKTQTIKDLYDNLRNGICPKIFDSINQLQCEMDRAQLAILYIQEQMGS